LVNFFIKRIRKCKKATSPTIFREEREVPEFKGRGGVYPLPQIGNSGLYARYTIFCIQLNILQNFLKCYKKST